MCAITGMPADTMRRICSALRTPPSSLTAWAPVSFMKRNGRVQGVVGPGLVGAERHVGDHEGALHGARDGAGERDELVDGDRERRVVAEHVVAGGVADQQEVDARLVEDRGGELVVAREPGDLDALLASRSGSDGCGRA